jgi:hypothetical protein
MHTCDTSLFKSATKRSEALCNRNYRIKLIKYNVSYVEYKIININFYKTTMWAALPVMQMTHGGGVVTMYPYNYTSTCCVTCGYLLHYLRVLVVLLAGTCWVTYGYLWVLVSYLWVLGDSYPMWVPTYSPLLMSKYSWIRVTHMGILMWIWVLVFSMWVLVSADPSYLWVDSCYALVLAFMS